MNAPTKPTGPSVRRHRSKQDYRTPQVFLDAVARRFGRVAHDLAATADNAVVRSFFSPEQDSLAQDWSALSGTLWLNPPFANIAPWAAKVASVRHRVGWTVMLVPASVGSIWFAEHCLDKTLVLGLSPRLTFVGEKDPYPKDLALVCAGFGVRGFDTWRWA